MAEQIVCGGGVTWLSCCGVELKLERDGGEWGRDRQTAIRCLDCGTLMCPPCARRHFAETDEKSRRIATLETALRDVDDVDGLACAGEANCASYAPCAWCRARAVMGPIPAAAKSGGPGR
jgi:hypothetical protein